MSGNEPRPVLRSRFYWERLLVYIVVVALVPLAGFVGWPRLASSMGWGPTRQAAVHQPTSLGTQPLAIQIWVKVEEALLGEPVTLKRGESAFVSRTGQLVKDKAEVGTEEQEAGFVKLSAQPAQKQVLVYNQLKHKVESAELKVLEELATSEEPVKASVSDQSAEIARFRVDQGKHAAIWAVLGEGRAEQASERPSGGHDAP